MVLWSLHGTSLTRPCFLLQILGKLEDHIYKLPHQLLIWVGFWSLLILRTTFFKFIIPNVYGIKENHSLHSFYNLSLQFRHSFH